MYLTDCGMLPIEDDVPRQQVRASRWLLDSTGFLGGQQVGRLEPVEDLISSTLCILN